MELGVKIKIKEIMNRTAFGEINYYNKISKR